MGSRIGASDLRQAGATRDRIAQGQRRPWIRRLTLTRPRGPCHKPRRKTSVLPAWLAVS